MHQQQKTDKKASAPPVKQPTAASARTQPAVIPAWAAQHRDQPMPIPFASGIVQAKLAVGAPDDPAEHEADHVAAQVTQSPNSQLQRRCACGGIAGAGGECAACQAKRLSVQRRAAQPGGMNPALQTHLPAWIQAHSAHPAASIFGPENRIQAKLTVGAANDQYEQEADRVAEQVLAAPANSAVSGAPPRIQRFAGQPTGKTATAPASVDQALASPSRPLEPALQQDMEQRFGHDFSRVRVHSGAVAEQSAREVNAHAYTVGHDIVFGSGRFAPGMQEGRRLIAHELTHVMQQSGSDGIHVDSSNANRGLSPVSFEKTSQTTSRASLPSWMPAPSVAPSGFGLAAVQPAAGNMANKRVCREEMGGEGTTHATTLAEFVANPPSATITVTLSGMTVLMDERAKLVPGPGRPQLMAVTLRALLSTQYKPDLVATYLKKLGDSGGTAYGLFAEGATQPATDAPAKGKPAAEDAQVPAGEGAQTIKRENKILLDAGTSFLISASLKASKFKLTLTQDQEEILITGFVADAAWTEMVALGLGPGRLLPDWYNEWIFDRQMASRSDELKEYSRGLERLAGKQRLDKAEASHFRKEVLEGIGEMLLDEADFVDAIRIDMSLLVPTAGLEEGRRKTEEEQAAKMYRELWVVPGGAGPDAPLPTKAKDEWLVSALLNFGHSQPAYRERSLDEGDRQARVEMLVRFGRFTQRVSSGAPSDEALRTNPAVANAPPFPSVIGAAPALPGPLFQAPLEAERRFLMKLEFRTVYEAFAFYSFRWQLVPVKYTPSLPELEKAETLPTGTALKPGETAKSEARKAAKPEAGSMGTPPTPQLAKPPSAYDENAAAASIAVAMEDKKALRNDKGENITNWDLLRLRYAKAAQYHMEDIQTIARTLGPAGAGASDLVTVNAIMRYAGAGLGTLLDVLFEKNVGTSSEKIITFPRPGIYIVRCIGIAVLSGNKDEELVRAPSVAYHPVFVRPSEEIAASSVHAARRRADDESALQNELEKVLQDKELTVPEREMLTGLQKDIAASKQGVKATLDLQLTRITESIKAKKQNERENAEVISQLEEEKERLEELLNIQRKRKLAQAAPLRVTFVSDDGQTLPLQMEATTRKTKAGDWKATVSDLTTINSGTDSGTGDTRDKAVLGGVQKVLMSSHGYGRGYVAVEISGKIETLRIAADVGQIAMEGIENLTTLLSIAAIAAAPFTGGATLTLLVPIGAVGAIPSVYRLVERSRVGTLRWDLNTAMDLVNIVGAAAGIGQAGVGSKIAIATAKGIRPGVWVLRAGRGLMVIGLASDAGGAVLMGAGIIEQLNALSDLPEGERKSRMFRILGGALLQAGITVGGSLAAHGVELQNQQRMAALDEIRTRPPTGEPLPHLPVEKTPQRDRQAGARDKGVDSGMTGAKRVTDAPNESPVKRTGDTATPKAETETPAKTTTNTTEPGVAKTLPSNAEAVARLEADPLRQALARGEDATTLELPAIHADRSPAAIPPDFTWASGVTEWSHAMQRYWEARGKAPGREVGVWRNAADGSYAVTVGSGIAVNPPHEAGEWAGVLHYHPNPDNTTRFQMPAPHDFVELMQRYQEGDGKVSVREFVDYGGEGQRQGRTEFGITAGDPMPFYVKTRTPSGEEVTLRFKDDGHFRQEWGSQEVYVGKEIANAMKADIDRWLAQVRGAQPDTMTGFDGRTTAGAGGTKSPPPNKKPKKGTAKTKPALTDMHGQLTEAGLAFLRQKSKKYREMSDNDIRREYGQHGTPRETVVREEVKRAYEGSDPNNPNAYLIMKGYRGQKKEPNLQEVVAELHGVMAKAGQASNGDPAILQRNVEDVIGLFNRQATGADPDLRAMAVALSEHHDPRIRAEWEHFYLGRVEPQTRRQLGPDVPGFLFKEKGEGFGLGTVATKRPDLVELLLGRGEIVVTDVTHRYTDAIHNFKTEFYRRVLETATGIKAVGVEYRALSQQTILE